MFQFKQFSIDDSMSGMKIGTDGVLLGAWAGKGVSKSLPLGGDSEGAPSLSVLDIGTGTGLITLMMAQRFPSALITGIDIDGGAAEEAMRNMASSPWKERIKIIHTALQDMTESEQFDLIVSNPPYFMGKAYPQPLPKGGENKRVRPFGEDLGEASGASSTAEGLQRTIARHTDCLPTETLIMKVARLLKDNEKSAFCVILPPDTTAEADRWAAIYGLFLRRRTWIKTKNSKPVKRVLSEYGKTPSDSITECSEVLLDSEGRRSEWYRRLTDDFYLDACAD